MMLRSAAGTDEVETLLDAIHADVFSAMDRVGQYEAAAMMDRVSVPIEYEEGPRGGVRVIRSKPGEPPRLETGNLHDSIICETESDAPLIATTISSNVEYAAYLQEGTFEMFPRPMLPDLDEFTDRLLDAIALAIEGY